MVFAVVAWLVASVCVALVSARVRRLGKLELPSVPALVERVESLGGSATTELGGDSRFWLDELVRDVDRETRVGSELPRSLGRVSLASGTALALLALIDRPGAPSWVAAVVAFTAGVVGTVVVSLLGRLADGRARQVREHWSNVARRARERL